MNRHISLKHGSIIFIILLGLVYRWYGISSSHSFWADETYVSHFARELIHQNASFQEIFQLPGLNYQRLQVIITAISFILFGENEIAARLPTVIGGTITILLIYLITYRLSNAYAGILASFMMAFSQLQLAHSTQAKPYTLIQMLLFLVIYIVISLMYKSARPHLTYHIIIIAAATAATFLHFIGVLVWIPYLVFIVVNYKKIIITYISAHPKYAAAGIIILFLISILMQIPTMIIELIHPTNGQLLVMYNHTTYLRELLWRNYAFIVLPAIFGYISLWKKNKTLGIGILLYSAVLIFLWNFRHYSHNIRYLVSLFGIMYILFALFWAEVGEKLYPRKQWLAIIVIIILLYAGGYKFVRKPSTYYSPNADITGDVQMANYKEAYIWLKQKYPKINTYMIYNDTPDTQLWYLDGRAADATFVKPYTLNLSPGQSSIHAVTQKPIYTSLEQFKSEMSKHEKGILIVEDWESFLPEDIKSYAKLNLTLEYRVAGIPQAGTDTWPIEIYSWGMETYD